MTETAMWTTMRKRMAAMQRCGYTEADKAAIRVYRKWLLALLVAFLTLSWAGLLHVPGAVGVAMAAFDGVAFTAILTLAWAIALRSGDEYRRLLLMRSLHWGLCVTLAVVTVTGYVQIHLRSALDFPLVAVPVMLCVTTAVAKLAVFRRERTAAL